MIELADIWDCKPAKNWHTCVACHCVKVVIWLGMCGACAVEHKRRTAEAVVLWNAELKAMQARTKEGSYATGI